MKNIVRSATRFLKREEGVTAVECAVMLALIVVICIVSIKPGHPTAAPGEPIVVQSSPH